MANALKWIIGIALGVIVALFVWYRLIVPNWNGDFTSWDWSRMFVAAVLIAVLAIVALVITFGLTEGTNPIIKARGFGWLVLFLVIASVLTFLGVVWLWPMLNAS